jgi:[ribosomal protein S18]-alanine N-acetyltransferase
MEGAGRPRMAPIQFHELDRLMAIETVAYPFPWSRVNFVDSLAAGYLARKRVDAHGRWLGYVIAMAGVDETHLLNLTVVPEFQRHGHARAMLDELVHWSRERAALRLWLEVRESNHRAQALYRHYGFREVGLRQGYYPAGPGGRENAVVMSFDMAPRNDALG